MSKLKVTLSLGLIIVQALLIGAIPFVLNDWFLTTPDAGGWACGAQTLADTGTFSDGRTAGLGYNFNVCWTKDTYPALQYFLAAGIDITGYRANTLVPLALIGILAALALIVYTIGWEISGSRTVALFAGLATSITPIVLRAHILTPQNLFGYLMIALLIWSIAHSVRTRRYYLWILVALIAALLGYVHSLSFGVAGITCAIWFYGWYVPNWRWRLVMTGIGIGAFILIWKFDILPIALGDAISLFKSGAFPGYDHPLYDHPAFLGYGLTVLAVVGLLFGQFVNRSSRWLILCWLFIPLLLGHLSIFGLILMPDRFIAYVWFGIVLLGAIGLERLRTLGWPSQIWLALAIIIWGAQLAHTIVYIQDDVAGWSKRFRPTPEFVSALGWLDEQPDQGLLVGIMSAVNREITFAPLWYSGNVASYPWYNLNHLNIKSFRANSSLYQPIFADPTHPEYLRIQAFYTIIARPKSDNAKTLAQQYNLAYLIIPKGSQADDIWKKTKPEHFPQIYENEGYRIFSLR